MNLETAPRYAGGWSSEPTASGSPPTRPGACQPLAYSVAKSGLAGLTRALALELAPEVRVNGVSPGAILWPEDGEAFPPAERERITVQTPLRRTGTPEDIAGAVKYFLFDAPFVTGQVLAVDGGRSIAL